MQNYQDFLSDLKTLISFKSYYVKGKENAPFGIECKNALSFMLKRAKQMGFSTVNYDNYMGEVYFGSGQEIGMIGHLDVVPEGKGWDTDPYVLTEKDGYLYGRGVSDNKTPLLAVLYALKELKDSGIKVNKKFRLFLGTNEETGWKDVEYAKTKTTFPEYGFSPDGDFPLSYAEKGMVELTFVLPKLSGFHSVSGGTVVNAVCSEVKITADFVENPQILKKFNLTQNGKIIKSVGVSAHGSHPENGVNAIKGLFEYLIYKGAPLENAYECLFLDKYKVFDNKSEQGSITFSPDLICEKKDGIYITCDLRYPYPFTLEETLDKFKAFNIPFTYKQRHGTQFVDKNSKLVNTLIESYNKITGENATPISQCGSTFARAFSKGVAFGPEGKENLHMHEANERFSVKDIMQTYEIYKDAIFSLAKE